jgi:hypothetical protein
MSLLLEAVKGQLQKVSFCTQALSLWKSTVSRIYHDSKKKERESGDHAKQRLRSCQNENQELIGRIDLLEVSFSIFIHILPFSESINCFTPSSLLYTKRQIRTLGHKPVVNEGCFKHHYHQFKPVSELEERIQLRTASLMSLSFPTS